MCGIAGIYLEAGRHHGLTGQIRAMTGLLAHRGPDEQGFHVDGNIALGHRRLAIIDLRTGQQPVYNENGKACIVFNGEIFNYRDIRSRLVAAGHRFSTSGDTETILHAYEEWGEDCVRELRGMFAFAIWDAADEKLFIARDRLGIKPLFYSRYGGKFVFASEMKSIISDPAFRRAIDEEALGSYFTFSYIPAPLTIFRDIRKLEPGHYLVLRKGRMSVSRYWDLNFRPDRRRKEKQIIGDFLEILRESVRMRLMSEVPIGAFLSGGVDSGTVVAMMSGQCQGPVKTFTVGFGGDTGGFSDERRYARLVAQRYATDHEEIEVRPAVEDTLEAIVRSFDEPFADDSTIPSYYICKAAREKVTVALSGLGGDEAFAGYERYLGFRLAGIYNSMPAFAARGALMSVMERLPAGFGGCRIDRAKRFARSVSGDAARQYLGLVSKLSGKYRDSFFLDGTAPLGGKRPFEAAEERFVGTFRAGGASDPLNNVFYCDLKTYLPEDILACTDRMSMAHSLEVRVPFLDHLLMEYAATIPPEMKLKWLRKKYLLKKGVRNLLPGRVIGHRKQGFVGPMAQWLRTDLKGFVRRSLSRENLGRHGLINQDTVRSILDDHASGRQSNDTLIWSLIVFQKWFDVYLN